MFFCIFRIDLAQDGKDFFIYRLLVDVMDIDIADDPLMVDDKYHPFRISFITQHTVPPRDHAVRPKIAHQWIRNPAQAFSPGLETGNVVYADTQNLGVQSLEQVQLGLIRRDLTRSYWCPGLGKENQYHVLTTVLA